MKKWEVKSREHIELYLESIVKQIEAENTRMVSKDVRRYQFVIFHYFSY